MRKLMFFSFIQFRMGALWTILELTTISIWSEFTFWTSSWMVGLASMLVTTNSSVVSDVGLKLSSTRPSSGCTIHQIPRLPNSTAHPTPNSTTGSWIGISNRTSALSLHWDLIADFWSFSGFTDRFSSSHTLMEIFPALWSNKIQLWSGIEALSYKSLINVGFTVVFDLFI